MTTAYCVLLLTVCLFAIGAQSINLANSAYPLYKANRERNNQLNGNIVCSDIAPGRTTVLNDTWASTDTKQADVLPPILGQDYFYIMLSSAGSNYELRQYAIAGKSFYMGSYSTKAVPTILQNGSVAVSSDAQTVILTADLAELFAPLTNFDSQIGYQNLIPYQSTFLLRPDTSDSAGFISVLDLTNNVSNAHWTANISCPGTIRNVMIYSPSSVDILVVAAKAESGTGVNISVDSNRYTIDGINMNDWAAPFIVDGVLYVFIQNNSVVQFNLDSRTFTGAISWDTNTYYDTQSSMIIRGSKALASLVTFSDTPVIIELISNRTIFANKRFAGHPTFSIPDNAAVFTTADDGGNLQLMALDWNTWEMKATGLFDQVPTGVGVSEAVFDDNCNVFVTTGNGIVHKFVPLPISDVVPVLDCIDEFNVAYFSYTNNQPDGLRIPYVADRNALSPDNVAPVTLFNVGPGDHYPFSARVQLQNASAEYQWRLEDYLLTFSITPQLSCPRNVSLTLTFTATDKFNVTSFVNLVVNTFVAVTGVRDTRISVVQVTTQNNVAKRMIRQGAPTLEVELEVSAGNSSEPTSAEVVKNLVNNQYNQFGNQVSSSPDAPTDTQLNGIVPKAPVNSQSGVLTPVVPPVAAPTNNPPPSETPQSTPVSPTSSGSRVKCFGALLLAVVILVLSF